MKLAFALMAAIIGSTGSWVTLSHGLKRPHHASPASARRHQGFSSFRGGGASAARDAVAQIEAAVRK
jgi:chorismate synthase